MENLTRVSFIYTDGDGHSEQNMSRKELEQFISACFEPDSETLLVRTDYPNWISDIALPKLASSLRDYHIGCFNREELTWYLDEMLKRQLFDDIFEFIEDTYAEAPYEDKEDMAPLLNFVDEYLLIARKMQAKIAISTN